MLHQANQVAPVSMAKQHNDIASLRVELQTYIFKSRQLKTKSKVMIVDLNQNSNRCSHNVGLIKRFHVKFGNESIPLNIVVGPIVSFGLKQCSSF